MSRVLITGGAGFIGSNLADALLARGDAVCVLDNLESGSLDNLHAAMAFEHFRFVEGDITDPILVDTLVRGCDIVVHLAARIGLKLVITSPLDTIRTNVKGTEIVLDAAARYKRRTLLASTSEVYGLATHIPSHEQDPIMFGSPTKGRWSYACTKALDEFLALALHRERALPATVLRLFNTVGPRQTGRYGMVLPRFVAQAIAGEPLTVYGDGQQTRCFCYVGDVVSALLAIMDEEKTIGEIYNVGNPDELRIIDLAHRVIALTNSQSTIRYMSFEEAYERNFEEIARRVPDITKIRNAIGFEPRTDLDQIIQSVIATVDQREYAT